MLKGSKINNAMKYIGLNIDPLKQQCVLKLNLAQIQVRRRYIGVRTTTEAAAGELFRRQSEKREVP
jgi:hypothetical protein